MSNYLADRRQQIGLTQKEVADAVGVSEGTVSRWESGEIANMKRHRIAALAKVLKCNPDFIMNGPQGQIPDGFEPLPATDTVPLVGRRDGRGSYAGRYLGTDLAGIVQDRSEVCDGANVPQRLQ